MTKLSNNVYFSLGKVPYMFVISYFSFFMLKARMANLGSRANLVSPKISDPG